MSVVTTAFGIRKKALLGCCCCGVSIGMGLEYGMHVSSVFTCLLVCLVLFVLGR